MQVHIAHAHHVTLDTGMKGRVMRVKARWVNTTQPGKSGPWSKACVMRRLRCDGHGAMTASDHASLMCVNILSNQPMLTSCIYCKRAMHWRILPGLDRTLNCCLRQTL